MDKSHATTSRPRIGVLIGGSGLVGGTLLHRFKSQGRHGLRILAPNSKELSLRVPSDIRSYFERVRPDFIINCAIATLDADAELTYEVNCRGTVYLARAARDLGIPYVHISSGAVMPDGEDLPEEARLAPQPGMSNYARGKLLAELALERMHEAGGLDFTVIRLAIVYGAHDHKIQGFHRLLLSIVNESMPALLTKRGARHSYSNARKLPEFVLHVLGHREEFSGGTYHFVDAEPVPLAELILRVKRLVGSKTPREIYVPYELARLGLAALTRVARGLTRIGIDARPPAEAVFLRSFYETQVLSPQKLRRSSWVDPDPGATLFRELPELVAYYLPRWEHLNRIPRRRRADGTERSGTAAFEVPSERLLASLLAARERPFLTGARASEPDLQRQHRVVEPREGEDRVAVGASFERPVAEPEAPA